MASTASLATAPRCRHTKLDGEPCKAPARRGHDFCLFHIAEHSDRFAFGFPMVEDDHSLLYALNQILRALSRHNIDQRTATTMLYALQLAAGAVHRLADKEEKSRTVELEPEIQEDLSAAAAPENTERDSNSGEAATSADPGQSAIPEPLPAFLRRRPLFDVNDPEYAREVFEASGGKVVLKPPSSGGNTGSS